jgi:Uncharacterized conserved protein
MKVKFLDKRIKNFLTFSILLVLMFVLIIAVFTYVYRYFTIYTYNRILLFLIILVTAIVVILAYTMLAVLYAYKKRRVGTALLMPVRLGLKIVIPFTIFITGVFKKNKDAIRSLFIDINNIIVESAKYQYRPEQILVILPHCLQDSHCGYKITGNINNCRQCGKCTIGAILSLVRRKAVKVAVVTGGTAARNLVFTEKPDVILSVACERDLAIGIADISRIPVLGIVNERPNGPCKDTSVNVELLEKKLDSLLIRPKEVIK